MTSSTESLEADEGSEWSVLNPPVHARCHCRSSRSEKPDPFWVTGFPVISHSLSVSSALYQTQKMMMGHIGMCWMWLIVAHPTARETAHLMELMTLLYYVISSIKISSRLGFIVYEHLQHKLLIYHFQGRAMCLRYTRDTLLDLRVTYFTLYFSDWFDYYFIYNENILLMLLCYSASCVYSFPFTLMFLAW